MNYCRGRLMKFPKILLGMVLITLFFQTSLQAMQSPWHPSTLKPSYLVLVEKESDKARYADYIRTRESSFHMTVVSLEEVKVENKAPLIRSFVQDYWEKERFRYLALDENIAYGSIKWDPYNEEKWADLFKTDFYYLLKNDIINKSVSNSIDHSYLARFFIGRISASFLQKEWHSSERHQATLALPFNRFAYRNPVCARCIDPVIDLAPHGENLKNFLSAKEVPSITLYEKRGTCTSKYPSSLPLTAENFTQAFKESTLVFAASTDEPIDLLKHSGWASRRAKPYNTLVTSYWNDKNSSKDVEYGQEELSYEIYYQVSNEDHRKRAGFFPIQDKPLFLDHFYCSLSPYESSLDKKYDHNYYYGIEPYKGVFKLFCLGLSVAEAFQTYLSSAGFGLVFSSVVWGPPETKLEDLLLPQSKKAKLEKYLILVSNDEEKEKFDAYISEREESYELRILSLEEKKVPNEAHLVSKLLKEYYDEFPYKYLVLFETISNGKVRYGNDEFVSDLFFLMGNPLAVKPDHLDRDIRYHKVFVSRITDSFLQKKWKKLFQAKALFSNPIMYYPRRNITDSWPEIFSKRDSALRGEAMKNICTVFRIPFVNLYETRGSSPSEFKPTLALNRENFLKEFANSNLVFLTSTNEPALINERNIRVPKTPKSILSTAIWEDRNKDQVVSKENDEIIVESLFDAENADLVQRVVFFPTMVPFEDSGVFYSMLTQTENLCGKYSYESEWIESFLDDVFMLFLSGRSLAEAFQLDLLSGNNELKLGFRVYGPPETTLYDLYYGICSTRGY